MKTLLFSLSLSLGKSWGLEKEQDLLMPLEDHSMQIDRFFHSIIQYLEPILEVILLMNKRSLKKFKGLELLDFWLKQEEL